MFKGVETRARKAGYTVKVVFILSKSQGGIRQHVAALVDELYSRNIDVVVVAPTSTMKELNIPQVDYEAVSRTNIFGYFKARKIIKHQIKSADIVHAHGVTAGFLALQANRGSRRVIVTLHNLILQDRKGIKRFITSLLLRYITSHADHIVFPSNYARDHSSIGDSTKSCVILPAKKMIPQSERIDARDGRMETRKQFGLSDNQLLFTCVARIHPQKNLSQLVRSFAEVYLEDPKARLIVAGSGSDETLNGLHKEIEHLGISNAVIFPGYIDKPHLLLAASDVCVLSSPFETVPFVLFEALQVGTPVVMCETGLGPEILHDELGTVVKSGDTYEFAQQMRSYAARESNKLDIHNREHVADTWMNPQNCIEPLLELYSISVQ